MIIVIKEFTQVDKDNLCLEFIGLLLKSNLITVLEELHTKLDHSVHKTSKFKK